MSLPKGEAAFNVLLRKYLHNAQVRGYDWALSKGDFRALTSQPCHYCGAQPHQSISQIRPDLNGDYIYNGLDRVDNARGYVADNVVPCCGICNRAKDDMTRAEFIAWARRVHEQPSITSASNQ